MEDDDEFGDLYADVLTPYTTPSAPQPPIHLTTNIKDEIFDNTPQTLKPPSFDPPLNQQLTTNPDSPATILTPKLEPSLFHDPKPEISLHETENIVKFDIEEEEEPEPEPIIPGVSNSANTIRSDEWDSDSEDDLQIVLNDTHHHGIEDEDDDGLVIVADNDQNPSIQLQNEEQDWGEEGADGKELADPSKPSANAHGYHQFHSQFKYVRPGAAPTPGAGPVAPGGAPGQFRPPVNMGPIAGRGRGDWRPPLQRGFQSGFGVPVWGANGSGRGFGTGMDFTLPSHKTIFEVDIDSFEEKPWRLQGIDVSDFFNFGLNEETWKDYCRQLEQLRLETTMQSKIRVYESGRAEQEYDPDMPPELAAAAAIHDVTSEHADIGKTDDGQSDLANGSARVRPQLPTGIAIQVETGYGERFPSVDTRPPRFRDSDCTIEIVLQDSGDDQSSSGNDNVERTDNDASREDGSGGHVIAENSAQKDPKHLDTMPQVYTDTKRELRRAPLKNSVHDVTEGDRSPRSISGAPVRYHPESRGQTSVYSGRSSSIPRDERRSIGRARGKSPQRNLSESTEDKTSLNNQKEESVESGDGKHRSPLSSPLSVGINEESDLGRKDATCDELVLADGSPDMEREEEKAFDTMPIENLNNEHPMQSERKQKLTSQVKQPSLQEGGDENPQTARSSENNRARSESSGGDYRDLRKVKRPSCKDDYIVRNKVRDEREEMERRHMPMKVREDGYYHKNWDSNQAHHARVNTVSIDRRKEIDSSDGAWRRKDEDPHGRRTRSVDTRKREHVDEMGPMYRGKFRENERSDKDERQLKKQFDNGSWRGPSENLKTRNHNLNDPHGKRRKEDVHLRRDHYEKEEHPLAHRENTVRRKRERDDILDHLPNKKDLLDQQRRGDKARVRLDDRHEDEGWFQRERVDRHRERAREESSAKWELEEGRGGVRSGRAAEDRAYRVKDEYKGFDREYHVKNAGRHSEQLKIRDRSENESLPRHRGNEDIYVQSTQLDNGNKRSRQERASSRGDRAVNAIDEHRVHEKKYRDNPRKSKESDGDHISRAPSRRNQENHSGQISERERLRGTLEQRSGEHEVHTNRQSSKKHKEDASSGEEQQDSTRGRSKFERWTSHKERDFNAVTKQSSSLIVKDVDEYKSKDVDENISKDVVPSLTNNIRDQSVDPIDDPSPLLDEKDGGDPEIKNQPMEDRHLDTVEKLKKRSERFKLPMPSEKETLMVIKKIESEPLPSVQTECQTESRTDFEMKNERPARKRRWTGN